MKKRKKKTFSMIKMICIVIALILLSGVGVMAVTTQVNTVIITLSNGYEMTVLTNKTNIGEILKEKNIVIESDEKVTPNTNEDLTEDGTIVISNKSEQEIEVAKVSESGIETTLDSLLQAYDTIVEKIEVVEEEIPYETVTKDVSNGASSTKNKVLKQGEKGIKEVTYKVKYQNNTEIERTKISEKVTKEPVDKIVQVSSAVVSSRSSDTTRTSSTSSTVKIYKVTAYCSCSICCGKYSSGYTSSGTKATSGRTVAAPSSFAYGTKLSINGKEYVVEDRGGAITGNHIDVYMDSHSQALAWGVKYLPVEVVE
jgi:3D (Asp-Asp-Asp) domain-containing protein